MEAELAARSGRALGGRGQKRKVEGDTAPTPQAGSQAHAAPKSKKTQPQAAASGSTASVDVGMVEAAAERGAQHAVEAALENLEVPSTTSLANAVAHCLSKSKLNVTRQMSERREEMQKALRDSNATLKGELQAQRG